MKKYYVAFTLCFLSLFCCAMDNEHYVSHNKEIKKFIEQSHLNQLSYQFLRFSESLLEGRSSDESRKTFYKESLNTWCQFKENQLLEEDKKKELRKLFDRFSSHLTLPSYMHMQAITLGLVEQKNNENRNTDNFMSSIKKPLIVCVVLGCLVAPAVAAIIGPFNQVLSQECSEEGSDACLNKPCMTTMVSKSLSSISPLEFYGGCYHSLQNFPPSGDFVGTVNLLESLEDIFTLLRFTKYSEMDAEEQMNIKGNIPELNLSQIKKLYNNIDYIAAGTANLVFKVTLAENRANIEEGTDIAIRCSEVKPDKNKRYMPQIIQAYAQLNSLRKITNYIPEIYGAYWGDYPSDFDLAYRNKKPLYPLSLKEGDTALYVEMELLKGPDYGQVESLEPRALFEHYIGNWAVKTIAGVSISDADGDVDRHHILTYDNNYVVYHIGEESYLFEPGYSPRQIDYDDFFYLGSSLLQKAKYFLNCIWGGPRVRDDYISKAFPEGIKFMESVCEKKGLFSSIREHFSLYRVSEENPIPSVENVKHYYIPDEYLDN